MAGFKLDQEHPQVSLNLNGYVLEVKRDRVFEADPKEAAGIIIATGPNEFLGAGTGFCVTFRPQDPGDKKYAGIATVDEGTFQNSQWTPGRRMNGDEDDQGRCWRFIAPRLHIEKAVVYRYE